MAQQRTKKAKVAHEKQSPRTASKPRGEYGIQKVEALVEWPSGTPAAVVALDAEGTRGIVSRAYVVVDAQTGEARPGLLACPAAYSPGARAEAVAAFRAWEAAAKATAA